jgi:hypothetical protein
MPNGVVRRIVRNAIRSLLVLPAPVLIWNRFNFLLTNRCAVDESRHPAFLQLPKHRQHPFHHGFNLPAMSVGLLRADAKPQKLTDDLAREAQLLITMGCGDKCPYVPGLWRDDWPLKDPKGLPIEEVRAIRDDIKGRVQALLNSEGVHL